MTDLSNKSSTTETNPFLDLIRQADPALSVGELAAQIADCARAVYGGDPDKVATVLRVARLCAERRVDVRLLADAIGALLPPFPDEEPALLVLDEELRERLAALQISKADSDRAAVEMVYQSLGEMVAQIGELAADIDTPNDHLAAAIGYMGRAMRHLACAVDLFGQPSPPPAVQAEAEKGDAPEPNAAGGSHA